MFFCFSLKKLWKLCGYILTIGLVFVLIRIVVLPQIFERPYSEVVEKHAQMYNVDENLIYSVMFTESGFDEKALSPKGAKGLMQIMDITGGWGGEYLKIENYSTEMLFDADVNIQIG
ncbi:MAG: lytic transglycosylase domain-containing protein, partial [Anaerotignaceae bacterium]